MTVETTCPSCGAARQIEVPEAGYKAWKQGELIQRALAELPTSEREALMTGYCDACWDKLFPEEER